MRIFDVAERYTVRLTFTVPGRIAGKQRARIFMRSNGKIGSCTPAKTTAHENNIGWNAARAMGSLPLIEGPVCVEINCWQSIPVSWSKKRKAAAIYVTGKPDPDNVAKTITDALNGIVYGDDSQICDLIIRRRYTCGAESVNIAISAATMLPSP